MVMYTLYKYLDIKVYKLFIYLDLMFNIHCHQDKFLNDDMGL